jgi:hypothetical protein
MEIGNEEYSMRVHTLITSRKMERFASAGYIYIKDSDGKV